MIKLHRFIAQLALLLAFVVGGQMTDLLPCADEGCDLWHWVSEDHVNGDKGEGHGEKNVIPDCLCHSTYTSTVRVTRLSTTDARHAFRQAEQALRPPAAASVPTPPPQS